MGKMKGENSSKTLEAEPSIVRTGKNCPNVASLHHGENNEVEKVSQNVSFLQAYESTASSRSPETCSKIDISNFLTSRERSLGQIYQFSVHQQIRETDTTKPIKK